MAVAYDATGNGGVGINSATTPLTWTHVNGGNCIIVGITFEYYNTNQITSVTYGGVSISFLGYVPSDNQGNGGGVSLYGLQGATVPGGSNTVSVAFDQPYDAIGGSVSYSGAGGLSAATTNYGSSSSIASAAITTHTGGILTAAACFGTSGGTWGVTGGNLRWSLNVSGTTSADNGAGGDIASTGSSQTITITNSDSDGWGIVAVEVEPVPPSTGPPLNQGSLPNFPVVITSSAGWRGAGHSR